MGKPEVEPPGGGLVAVGAAAAIPGGVGCVKKVEEKALGGVLGRQGTVESSKEVGTWRVCMSWKGYNYGDAVDVGPGFAGRGSPPRGMAELDDGSFLFL
eukprot:3813719-Amphidinium_carterae.1